MLLSAILWVYRESLPSISCATQNLMLRTFAVNTITFRVQEYLDNKVETIKKVSVIYGETFRLHSIQRPRSQAQRWSQADEDLIINSS